MAKKLIRILFFILNINFLFAQNGLTTCYPKELYPGMNFITIENSSGIDRITYTKSSRTIVKVPVIKDCPKSVDISAEVLEDSTQESISLTVYACNGTFSSYAILQRKWQILKEKITRLRVGRDTCIKCVVYSGDKIMIDSITIAHPDCKIKILSEDAPPYQINNDTLHYRVCFKPTTVIKDSAKIVVHVKRSFPNKGLFTYSIAKPLKLESYIPEKPVSMGSGGAINDEPNVIDPTFFRHIAMPTAETIDRGKSYVGNYDVVGWVAGIGLAPRIEMMFLGSYIPESIFKVRLISLGLKYEPVRLGLFNFLVGTHVALSESKDSKIRLVAPYGILSYGNKENRISIGGGYAWKEHTKQNDVFNRDATIAAIGGYYQFAKNWKVAGEWYYIETSGIAPVAATCRYFTDKWAFDFGLGMDLSSSSGLQFTSALGGEVKKVSIGPILSFFYTFN